MTSVFNEIEKIERKKRAEFLTAIRTYDVSKQLHSPSPYNLKLDTPGDQDNETSLIFPSRIPLEKL